MYQIGDEPFAFFVDCEDPKSCSILLRGANKVRPSSSRSPPTLANLTLPIQDVLNEIERNLIDAMAVARNVVSRVHPPPHTSIQLTPWISMFSTPNSCPEAAPPR